MLLGWEKFWYLDSVGLMPYSSLYSTWVSCIGLCGSLLVRRKWVNASESSSCCFGVGCGWMMSCDGWFLWICLIDL